MASVVGSKAVGRVAAAARLLGDAVCDLVFPWRCLLCEDSGPKVRGPFCSPCRGELLKLAEGYAALSCPRCALPVGPFADLRGGCHQCRRRPLGFDSAIALGGHEAPWRDFVLNLKKERWAFLAPTMAALWAEARRVAFDAVPADALVVAPRPSTAHADATRPAASTRPAVPTAWRLQEGDVEVPRLTPPAR